MSKPTIIKKPSRQHESLPAAEEKDPSEGFLSLVELWQNPGSFGEEKRQEEELQQKRERLLAQAREDAEQIRTQAYQEGFGRGEQEGKAAGLQSYTGKIKQLEALLQSIARETSKRNAQYEAEILLLVKTLVERLVHHEVSLNDRVIQACLHEALQYVVENAQVKIHLHADDFQRLREASLENPVLLEGRNRIQLIENPVIAAGGCLLETDFGEVDATLENSKEKLFAKMDSILLVSLAEEEANGEG